MADGFDRGALTEIARRLQSRVHRGKMIRECLRHQRIHLFAVALYPFGDALGAKGVALDCGLIENRVRHIHRHTGVEQIVKAVGDGERDQRPRVGYDQLGMEFFIGHGVPVRLGGE